MSRAGFWGWLLVATFAAVSSCQIVGGYESFQAHPCNALPASKLDPNGIATVVLAKQSDGQCFWIDRTEVTVQQYSAFLQADGGSTPWSMASSGTPSCTWKGAPSNPVGDRNDTCAGDTNGEDDPFGMTKPIRCVDWCDADRFCRWAQKYLCGGNKNGTFDVWNGLEDQWGYACSADGSNYPTGTTAVLGQCNVGLAQAGLCENDLHQLCGPVDVDAPTQCTGASGTVHMIGNVAEWVSLCSPTGDAGTLCQTRGGSFAGNLNDEDETCYTPGRAPLNGRDRTIGFRCCMDLSQEERSKQDMTQ